MKRLLQFSLLITTIIAIIISCAKEEPEVKKFNLTVSASEGGSVSTQGGVYVEGEIARVTATPSDGYVFSGWSNGSSDNPIQITMNSNTSITANFTKVKYAIDITVDGQGSVTEEVVSSGKEYDSGSVVKLTAVPSEGWLFSHWSGASNVIENTVELTADSNKSITAHFIEIPFEAISVGDGTIATELVYNNSNEVTAFKLTATTPVGWRFDGWTGGVQSSEMIIEVATDLAENVTATFIQVYDLTLNIVGEGEVTDEIITDTSKTFDAGTNVKLTAVPASGWRFDKWTGSVESNEAVIVVNVDDAKEITATFIQVYDLTVTVEGEGAVTEEIVTTTDKTTSYDAGVTVQLTAEPAEGWRFDRWTGAIESTETAVQIEMSEAKEVTATFVKIYDLNITIVGEGEVTQEIINNYKTSSYVDGTNVKLTAIPADGWHFLQLQDDIFRQENPYIITLNKQKNIVVVFERDNGTNVETNLFSVKEQVINIKSNFIDDDDLANSIGWSSSQTYFNDNNSTEHLILPAGNYQTLEDQVTLHLYKNYNSDEWIIDKEYLEPSFGDARDYDPFGENSFIYADHGQEFHNPGDNRQWPYGYIWLAENISKNNIEWKKISNYKSFYHSVASGDLNNDGLLDVIAIHLGTYSDWGDNIHLWFQNQDGTFTESKNSFNHENDRYLQDQLRPYSVEIKDLNNDGYGEVIFGSMNKNVGISIYNYNSNSSKFEEYFKSGKVGVFNSAPSDKDISPTTIESKDVDNDGIIDLIVVAEGYNSIQVWKGHSDLTFTPGQIVYEGYQINSREFEIFDIDNDGDLDITMNPINIWESTNLQYIDDYTGINGYIDISQLIWFNNGGLFERKNLSVKVPFNNVNGIPRLKGGLINNVFKFFTIQTLTSKKESGTASVKIVEVIPKFQNW